MVEDVVRALGYLTLGSRFRRIGERLQADTQQILDGLETPVPSGLHPFLAALDRLGPLSVGELAEAVGITQPGATRSIAQLVALGLVEAKPAPGDQRRKQVSLTRLGRRFVDAAKGDAWPRVEGAVRDLCDTLSGPLLEQLAAIEDGLAEAPLERRIRRARQVSS